MCRRSAQDRFTRAGNWVTRSVMPLERCSTIPTSSSPAVSAMVKPKPGPLATGWHSNKFLNPITDGAVLPILHLNGYKIANPTLLARIPREELEQLLHGYVVAAILR